MYCIEKEKRNNRNNSFALPFVRSDTDQLYINLNATADGAMLLAGDDTGSIWLYNLQGFAPWGGTAVPDPDSLYQPSRIIEWPEIHIKSNDMGDLKDPTVRRMESESSTGPES